MHREQFTAWKPGDEPTPTRATVTEIAHRHLDRAPLTARERTRLTQARAFAQIIFRGDSIANATIEALLAEDFARSLPVFAPRPWPLARLGLRGPA